MPFPEGMKLVPLLVVLAATPLAHAPMGPFEGRILVRLQDTEPHGASYTVRDDRVRIDVPSVGGKRDVHAVADLVRGTFVLKLGNGSWSRVAVSPVLQAPERVTVHETGRARAVVGQPCEEWTMKEEGRTVEACVVPGTAWFDPRRLVGGEVPGWSLALEARRAFPLSVWVSPDAHTPPFHMWATDVKPQPVSDDAFATPRTARVK
jgi:hypothetical protein